MLVPTPYKPLDIVTNSLAIIAVIIKIALYGQTTRYTYRSHGNAYYEAP